MEEAIKKLENGEISPSSFVSQTFNEQITFSGENPDKKSNAQIALDLINQRQKELEKNLRSAVCANSDELLQNATDVKYLRDNVSSLKAQIMKTRNEAQLVASNILTPFESIQSYAIQLNSMYKTCKELRTLLRFLELIRKIKTDFSKVTKIERISNDLRECCELCNIARSGEINKIVVYQKFWAKVKPNCDKMISIAEKQLNDSIESQNVDSATIAITVFIYLGTLSQVAKSYYNKYIRMLCLNRYDKCMSEEVFSIIQNDFKNYVTNICKIALLHQSVSNAILKSSEPERIKDFDLNDIDPAKAIVEYANNVKNVLTKISNTYPNISNEIISKIPQIRKELFLVSQKLPPSIDQNYSFSIVVNVFSSFQEAFIKQTSDDIKNLFFNSFVSSNTDSKIISINCETIQNRLSKYDRDLMMKFRDPIINLANGYFKMKNSSKQSLKEIAKNNNAIVKSSLQSLGSKLFSDEVGNKIASLLA